MKEEHLYTDPRQRSQRPVWAALSWLMFAAAFVSLVAGLLGFVPHFPHLAILFLGLGIFLRIRTDRPVKAQNS